MQYDLIPASVLEVCKSKPPSRDEWYVILYVTRGGFWTFYRESKSSAVYAAFDEQTAREKADRNKLKHARIVRIPAERP